MVASNQTLFEKLVESFKKKESFLIINKWLFKFVHVLCVKNEMLKNVPVGAGNGRVSESED